MFRIFEIFDKKMRFLIGKYKIEKNRKSEKIGRRPIKVKIWYILLKLN